MITKVMLPNPLFIQGSKLFGVPYKDFIKEQGFDRRKILNINSKKLSKLGDNSSNTNSPNKTITNELNSPLNKLPKAIFSFLTRQLRIKRSSRETTLLDIALALME